MATYYELLEIQSNATPKQIKAAWKRFAGENHPDHGDENGAATERFKQVTAAYECLSDPDRRKAYDATLRSSGPKTTVSTPPPRASSQGPGRPGSIQPWVEPPSPTVQPKPPSSRKSGPSPVYIVAGVALGALGLLAAGNYAPKDASGRRRDRHTGRYRSGPFW